MNLIWLLRTPLATAFVLTYGYLNDFGRLVEGPPTISAHACVILRSLEWLAHSLIDNVNDISAKDAATLLEEPERQDSPLAVGGSLGALLAIRSLTFPD